MANPDEEEEAFVVAAAGSAHPPAEWRALWRRARQRWPTLQVAPEVLAARAVSAGVAPTDLAIADLLLAASCLHGDRAALAELDALLHPIRAGLVRRGADADVADDAVQIVRMRLLLPPAQQPRAPDTEQSDQGKLATYRGGGSLAAWLRVVAVRQLRSLLRASPKPLEAAVGEEAMAADAPLAVLAHTHGPVLRKMFRAAVAALDEPLRQVLQMEIVEQLPHQQIATRLGTHRTTVVRWAEHARQAIRHDVRRRLMQELHLGASTADSILRDLGARLELSVGAALAGP